MSCFPGRRIASENGLRVGGWIEKQARFGEQGEVPIGASHWTETEPSHDKQFFWRFKNEDGEKPSARHRGGSGRFGRCTGGRSSRQGQAGPVREDLLALRCWLLLHAGHGYLH